MADALVLVTQPRQTKGSGEARRLRRRGLVPAVMYGHGEGTAPISLSHDDLLKVIRHGTHVVDLQSEGNVQKALIREVQWDHLGKDILHVDFARVAADERVVVTVPLEIRGTAAGIAEGGMLDQPMHSLSVECLVTAVPEHIRVNVGTLKLGEALHVRDLALPPGVTAMADPDAIVVHVTQKQVEAEEAAAPVAEGAAEPEVIGRTKEEEEGAE